MVIKLIDKIYEDIEEKQTKVSSKYMKTLGIVKDENAITGIAPKQNLDFMIILHNLGLIESNSENMEKIDEFYKYLFKLGLEIGVHQGKKLLINALKKDMVDFDELMEFDIDILLNFDFEPTFITDMKEALNEK